MPFSSIQEVKQYLNEIPKFKNNHDQAADFNLQKFKRFCRAIGTPQHNFTAVHVAGTNGKGSTSRILASIYQESGYKIGLFTSPHILEFNERFAINGQLIPNETLLTFFQDNYQLMEEHNLTYFEISTAIAFWWFSRSEIDLGVIEAGLGGRLDATNIVCPEVSIITSISFDHTNILGDNLEDISREKGGIIKADTPVVAGRLPESAQSVIRHIAENAGARLYGIEAIDPTFKAPSTVELTIDDKRRMFKTPFKNPVQALNIAIAWQGVQSMKPKFSVSLAQFRRGLRKINPGRARFEQLREGHQWYFDGAHNLEAARELKRAVRRQGSIDEAVLVLSFMGDKITPSLMNEFSEFKNIYYYTLKTERAAPVRDIIEWLPQVTLFPSQKGQRKQLLKELNSKLVISAGSFYFYPTVRDWISRVH